MFRRNRIALLIFVLCLEAAPFLFAAGLDGPVWAFGGFIANPIDGASYLAKMQEGWAGGWSFTLYYSAQPSGGAPLFLFYIGLGHLARLLGISLVWTFHIARVFASVGLLAALAKFSEQLFPDDPLSADRALWLVTLGSGMGWVGMLFSGQAGADLWVSEGYPFLSMFVNPHFPCGLALILWILLLDQGERRKSRVFLLAILGLLLAVIQPFGVVIAALVLGLGFIWAWWMERRFDPVNLIAGLSLGGPFLLYQFWAINSDPILAAWNRQNLTPAPALWDFLLSFSPGIILALVGVYAAWRGGRPRLWAVLVGWLLAGAVLVYLPFSLQRRFMTGFFVPVAFLAVGAIAWFGRRRGNARKLFAALFGLSVLTNLFFILLMVAGLIRSAEAGESAPSGAPIFLDRATMQALMWAREHTPTDSVILADTTSGLFVPAWSGRRTVYGHPFETPNARIEKQAVDDFYSGAMSATQQRAFLSARGIDYILTRQADSILEGPVLYERGGVRIIEVAP